MTKGEIKSEYGRFYDESKYYYSANGWTAISEYDEKTIEEMMFEINLEFRNFTVRPKSLAALDKNTDTEKVKCYEIWRPNIPDNGCTEQCKECKEKDRLTIYKNTL